MKKILLVFVSFFFLGSLVQAQESSFSPINCFQTAKRTLVLLGVDQTDMLTLCGSAHPEHDSAPVNCFLDVRRTLLMGIDDQQAAALCARSISNAPVDCFLAARRISLSNPEIIQLCAGARSNAPVECLLSARVVFSELDTRGQATLCNMSQEQE